MKRFVAALAAFGMLSGAALAQTGFTFEELDIDGNGELSFEEVIVAWPDLTEADFAAADLDQSGGLSPDEIAAFQQSAVDGLPAETLPAPADAPAGDADTLVPDYPTETQTPHEEETDDSTGADEDNTGTEGEGDTE